MGLTCVARSGIVMASSSIELNFNMGTTGIDSR